MLDEEEEINLSSNQPTVSSLLFELNTDTSSQANFLGGVSLCPYCLGTFHSQNVWQEFASLSQVTNLAWVRYS